MSDTTPRPRRSKAKNTYTTKSGNTIKLNQSLSDRMKANKEAKARRKAAYLSTLPKEKWKRILYRLHPKRVIKYWFSREGAIMALKITGISFVVMFLLIVGLFAYFRKDLPKIKDLSGSKLGGSITYYDRTGQVLLWQDYDTVKREGVASDKIAQYMKDATIAIEDKDFYKHGAFDVRGLLRAGINDVKGGSTQGGSTITQQLVKVDQDWGSDRTIGRKVKELILAVELEREYSKDDILTGYLNLAPYGSVDYGVQVAARDYFGVDAKDLSLAQATILASIPKSPTDYSPYSSPKFNEAVTVSRFDEEGLIGRQHYILDQMVKQGYITKKQAEEAKKVDVLAQVKPIQNHYAGIKAPYYLQAAKQELQDRFGSSLVKLGGWRVTTTLDMNLQTTAEKLVADNMPNVTKLTHGLADEQATVTEDVQTGQIVALVGGVDFTDKDHGSINYATSKVSPGSSFKPYDYAAFIDNNTNVGAGSVLYDTQGAIPGYPCTDKSRPTATGDNSKKCLYDYDFNFPGPITLRYALGGSRNVPAEKAMLAAVPNDTSSGRVNSINKTITMASDMMYNTEAQKHGQKTYNCYRPGIDDVNSAKESDIVQCYNSAAIGDGAYLALDDHVNGLATFARMGQAIPRTYILEVTSASGKSLYKFKQPEAKQVIKPDTAYILNDMAADPKASYLPGSCTDTNCTKLSSFGYKFHRFNGWKFAIKTGTTNYGFDGLMTSWSTKYAVVTWTGNHTRNVDISKYGAQMETLTEPVTRGMMEAAHTNVPAVNWTQPTGLKSLPAFVLHAKVSRNGEIVPSPSNDLFPSWYVAKAASNTSQTTDKVSGKLATSCTPDLAKQTSTNSNASSWNVDVFVGGSASSTASTGGNDDVHNCSDTSPSINITAIGGSAGSTGNCTPGSSCTVRVFVQQGTHSFNDPTYPNYPGTINLLINGQVNQTLPVNDSGNYDFTYTSDSGASGTATVTVQVVDSVLYTGSDNGTINFTSGGHGGGNSGNGNGNGGIVKPVSARNVNRQPTFTAF